MSEVINANLQIWRQKAADGSITIEEMRDAIAAIRRERVQASAVSSKSTATRKTAAAKAAPINSDDLLKELGI